MYKGQVQPFTLQTDINYIWSNKRTNDPKTLTCGQVPLFKWCKKITSGQLSLYLSNMETNLRLKIISCRSNAVGILFTLQLVINKWQGFLKWMYSISGFLATHFPVSCCNVSATSPKSYRDKMRFRLEESELDNQISLN